MLYGYVIRRDGNVKTLPSNTFIHPSGFLFATQFAQIARKKTCARSASPTFLLAILSESTPPLFPLPISPYICPG